VMGPIENRVSDQVRPLARCLHGKLLVDKNFYQ
jgi:hypothetical protein